MQEEKITEQMCFKLRVKERGNDCWMMRVKTMRWCAGWDESEEIEQDEIDGMKKGSWFYSWMELHGGKRSPGGQRFFQGGFQNLQCCVIYYDQGKVDANENQATWVIASRWLACKHLTLIVIDR